LGARRAEVNASLSVSPMGRWTSRNPCADTAWMKPGDLLGGRFELERHAGSGGMGEVFRAWDRATGEPVAVKVLLEGRAPDHLRFAREAGVLAELSHPGIVRYVAHGLTPSGEPYLAMEWLEGEDLSARLRQGRLTVDETMTVGVRAAQALAAAHAHGVVHRDLKPSNLFLLAREVGRVKVLDFGIARRHGATPMTKTGAVLGTPGYMAPEQVRSGGDIDARADVFALGCVLFECVTGAPLFTGEQFMAILAKILFQEAPWVSEQVPDIPKGLDVLIARMLSKDRDARPSDGAAVAEALRALGTGGTLQTVEETSRPLFESPSALTGSERWVMSVVLLAQEPALNAAATTLDEMETPAAEALCRTAEAHGGRLELLTGGSAIVRIAWATRIATDQAVQAARCALALRAVCRERPMALATGRAEGTGELLVGDAIDRAARMLANLGPEERRLSVLAIDEVTAGLLDARFEVVEGAAALELRGEHALAEGARTLLGKPTACVGRDWELSTLEALLQECLEESVARAVLVTAPAGIGKSRLAYELMDRVRRGGEAIAIWIGRGDSLRAGSTFGLLRQALGCALRIQEGEPVEARRQKLWGRVAEHVMASEQQRVSEFLGELVGTPFPDEESVPLRAARKDAQLMGDQLRMAWVDFLRAESAAHPVLVVLEDLHWGDLPTVRFIDAALRDVRGQAWMVLALARPEVHELFPKLWAERQVQEVRLKELSRKASERLVRQVLGDGVDAETVERMIAQAEGHAFYLEELIRAVAEGKGAALPETVLAMVEARLAGLEGEARRVLRAASVFGEVCWEGGVAKLLGGAMRSAQAGEWLARLVEREVLVRRMESRFPGERELAFRHALLREGAYAMLTDEDRALGHRLAGEWLERRGESDAMVLAGHFDKGNEPARAGGFYLRSAQQANLGGDTNAAIHRARLGLACGVPDDLRRALLGMLCEAHHWQLQTVSAAMPYAEELLRLAPRGSVPWAQGAFAKIGATIQAGRIEEFMATLRVVQEADPSPDAAGPLSLAVSAGAYVLDFLGRVREADAVVERLAEIACAAADRQSLALMAWNGFMSVRNAYAHEDPFCALQCADTTVAIAETINFRRMIISAQMLQGMNQWFLGALALAEPALQGAAMADEQMGLGTSVRRFSLSWMLADRGALDEARHLASQLIEDGRAQHLPLDEARGRWALAEVRCRAGDLASAEPEIEAALALLSVVAPLDHPGALATLAAIRLSQGRASEALSVAEDALSRYEAMGACGFFRGAFVRLVHARALYAAGQEERARAAIAIARARLLANAEKIGDPVYRKTFLENVPENARTLELARTWLDFPEPVR
jgi:eukaryotic-like serine/threonine-protein kinase